MGQAQGRALRGKAIDSVLKKALKRMRVNKTRMNCKLHTGGTESSRRSEEGGVQTRRQQAFNKNLPRAGH